jgi:hypothetical protein
MFVSNSFAQSMHGRVKGVPPTESALLLLSCTAGLRKRQTCHIFDDRILILWLHRQASIWRTVKLQVFEPASVHVLDRPW